MRGAVLLILAAGARSLVWEDCGGDSEIYELVPLNYSHSPDPIISSAQTIIAKSFRFTGNETLRTLREIVSVQKSSVDPNDPSFPGWPAPYFNNSFEVGDAHDVLPVEPGTTFNYQDIHSPSSSTGAQSALPL